MQPSVSRYKNAGVGLVIRDYAGELITTLCKNEEYVASPKIDEILALKRATLFCMEIGCHEVISFEGDAKTVIDDQVIS